MHRELADYFDKRRKVIDKTIKKYFPLSESNLNKAIRYSLTGGKRLRPLLVFMGAEACHGQWMAVLPAACAVEMIHTYSLIHDDLPAMDNDNLRRGRWTCHRKYGEAEAILAGDALLTKAFEIISSNDKRIKGKKSLLLEAIHKIAVASGVRGMVGGQAEDIRATKTRQTATDEAKKKALDYIHRKKTASLISGSLEVGALLAGAGRKQLMKLRDYGMKIGLAFQITDDILDLIGDKKKMGKEGSDTRNKKLTHPCLYGIPASRKRAKQLVEAAKESLKSFGRKARMLCLMADYIGERTY